MYIFHYFREVTSRLISFITNMICVFMIFLVVQVIPRNEGQEHVRKKLLVL